MLHSAFRITYIEARAIQFDVNARPILDGVGFTISLVAGWRLNRKFHSPFAFYDLNSLIRNFTQLQFYNAFGCAKITTEKRSWFIITCYVLYVFLFVSPFFWGTWTRCVCVHREPCAHVFKHVWRHFNGHWTFNGWNEAYTQVWNLTLYLNFG